MQIDGNANSLTRHRQVIREAIRENDWLRMEYDGKDVVVIPRKLEITKAGAEILKGVKAENSEFRSYRTDKIGSVEVLPDSSVNANQTIGTLQEAIRRDANVVVDYRLPGAKPPVTLTLDPCGFDFQPDGTVALDAKNELNQQRSYRLDRINHVIFAES